MCGAIMWELTRTCLSGLMTEQRRTTRPRAQARPNNPLSAPGGARRHRLGLAFLTAALVAENVRWVLENKDHSIQTVECIASLLLKLHTFVCHSTHSISLHQARCNAEVEPGNRFPSALLERIDGLYIGPNNKKAERARTKLEAKRFKL